MNTNISSVILKETKKSDGIMMLKRSSLPKICHQNLTNNNKEMKSTITTPDELTTLRIEGSSGTYKIFSSFRPMESPAFVDAVDRKYNLAEIKNLSGGKGYFLVHLNREQQKTIQEDLNAILCDSVPCLL